LSGKQRLLAIIPARGGSKGLPGKNIRLFAGLPLIAHSILLAKMCPEISRLVVSTDSPEIAEVGRRYGADVPFLRPVELASDETPMWPVLRYALQAIEQEEGDRYDYLLLLDPTSPAREAGDISAALGRLLNCPAADGVVGVSRPDFNPIWHCVLEHEGWMVDLIDEGSRFERRQDVKVVYRINGVLYIWRADFVRKEKNSWRRCGKHLIYEIPEMRAMSIDSLDEFKRAEALVQSGLIRFPWLDGVKECVP
jgi:N-acylneuraminate cytidylyltransferase